MVTWHCPLCEKSKDIPKYLWTLPLSRTPDPVMVKAYYLNAKRLMLITSRTPDSVMVKA